MRIVQGGGNENCPGGMRIVQAGVNDNFPWRRE